MKLKLISWNVNGLRAVMQKGFMDLFKEEPDILCLQEIKAHPEQVQINPEGYHQYWNSAEKKGYSGTLVFTKIKPVSVIKDLGEIREDDEGRVITLEYDAFFLVNVYTPNSKRELKRLDYRQEWDRDFQTYIKDLEKSKPVVICGDMNVAHKEIDLANPKTNKRNAGFTDEEREGFDRLIDAGLIDTFRMFNTEPGNYTWWSYMFNARKRNIGWRIDYFLVSQSLSDSVTDASIRSDIMGSDHCPISLILDLNKKA